VHPRGQARVGVRGRILSAAVFESPAGVAGLDDVAMVGHVLRAMADPRRRTSNRRRQDRRTGNCRTTTKILQAIPGREIAQVARPLNERMHYVARLARFGAEHVDHAGKGIEAHRLAHQRGQPLASLAEVDRLRRYHHPDVAGWADHGADFSAWITAAITSGLACAPTRTVTPPISISTALVQRQLLWPVGDN
jgi:hypothetical protein